MNSLIAIGGPPASGKTTLVRQVLYYWDVVENHQEFKKGLLRGRVYPKQKKFVLGIYDGENTFGGTDRLSMAVQEDAEDFARALHREQDGWTVLFEGDRLFNARYLHFCHSWFSPVTLIQLTADPRALQMRHRLRKDTQDETWLKGRESKCANLLAMFPETWVLRHDGQHDTARIARAIVLNLFGDVPESVRDLEDLIVKKEHSA